MNTILYLNGTFAESDKSCLPVDDRSYLMGDGLFETFLVRAGKVIWAEEHLKRIAESASYFGYNLPDLKVIDAAIKETVRRNSLREGSLRLTVSPRESEGLLAAASSSLNISILCRPGVPYEKQLYSRGFTAIISRETCRNQNSPLAHHKTTSFLDNVLAKKEAQKAGCDEALLLNTNKMLCEGSVSNLFVIIKEKVLTAPVEEGALPGIVRKKIIQEACPAADLDLTEKTVSPPELYNATEAFLTNSLLGVMPLVRVDGKELSDGKPGRLTLLIQKKLLRLFA